MLTPDRRAEITQVADERGYLHGSHDCECLAIRELLAEAERLAAENARLREIVQEVVDGTDFCDPRMKYGECQIGRGQLEEMKAALAPPE